MTYRKIFLIFLISVISIAVINYGSMKDLLPVLAQEEEEEPDSEQIEDLEDKINEYEEKLNKLQNQEQSLAKEIQTSDSQINLTQLKIQSTQAKLKEKEEQIIKLAGDIDELKIRIEKLGESIKHQEYLLKERLRSRYKNLETSPMMILFGANTLNKLVQKTEYLKVLELQDHKLLDTMNQTKMAFGKQKTVFEDKKEEEEELKQQITIEKANLESYRAQLEEQKIQKQRLLEETQNDESKYQKLLEEARRELNQILGAVSVLKNQESKKVKKGEVIGIQGNTGYSFGDHLHFGVYRYSSFEDIDGWNWYYSNQVNPAKKLKKKDVYWNTGCESAKTRSTGEGDWAWPLSNPTISQGYGNTCWSSRYYGGKPHPALDMYGPYGSPIYAVEEGRAYFCRNCLGDGANGVFIFHPDDYMTVYWHLK